MDSETPIARITNQSYDDEVQETEGGFKASWQPSDAALLLPNNLAIPKVQRAWDRKPLSPFSRQRLRVGKVWKRATSAPSLRSAMTEESVVQDRASKTRKARNSLQGLLKPVKKMCLASDFGMASRVLQWDAAESPVRKIVTRSSLGADEMVALPDEEEEGAADDEVDVTVEILDEDGTLLDVGGTELAQEQDWEDEVDTVQMQHFDGTVMHLGDLTMNADEDVEGSNPERVGLPETTSLFYPPGQQETDKLISVEIETETEADANADADADSIDGNSNVVGTDSLLYTASDKAISHSIFSAGAQSVVLPDGFVSPVKRPFSLGKKSARQSLAARRRTLPVQFAPFAIAEESVVAVNEKIAEAQQQILETETTNTATELRDAVVHESTSSGAPESEMEQEWEDVEDESASPQFPEIKRYNPEGLGVSDGTTSDTVNIFTVESGAEGPEFEQSEPDVEMGTQVSVVRQGELRTQSKLQSSQIPSIDEQHPRLPLRRSPRRKSSSPLNLSTILPSVERSHLIAFTPLRGPSKYPLPSNHPGVSNPFLDDQIDLEPGSPLERAASAPPEEPQMSPQKPSRPRVSDDTALLQAFLNRAAESKSSRRISATKKESITNRRDSDAVRQALASPAKADVLGDLDPNSPSPRKPSAALDQPSVFDGIALGPMSTQEQSDDTKSGPTTRRGDRAARRGQPQTPAAPNKIAIRGNAENVLIKKSEAQELANLTRNNTRKNKGGAVLPPLRLTKLASLTSSLDGDGGTEDAYDASQVQKPDAARSVKWAETLVEFHQGGETSESSILSDEMNGAPQQEPSKKMDSDAIAAPPPPSETPSKPKIRRLKPSRTAATPGKPTPGPPAAETEKASAPEQTSKQQAKPAPSTKRRSRIATPAKGLTSASLLPADVEHEPTIIQPKAAEKKPGPKKKTTISKLPAPASLSTSSSSLGQGKENLISSPPKKRTVPTAKAFAPKLDFGSKTQLQPGANGASDGDAVPGLTSPAKKGKGRGVVFGNALALDLGVEKTEEAVVPGLTSPAKKRTRRAGGV